MQTTIPEVSLAAPHNSVMYTARPQLTTYKYDQLNRIREMRAYHDFVGNGVLAANAYTGAAATLTNTYRNEFTYDGNGNIETQKRYDDGNVLVDDLTYQYDIVTGGSPKKRSNKLYHINDAGTTAPGDINDMGTFTPNTTGNLSLVNNSNNCSYDEIGNLVKDVNEEINNIDWTVYGKIKTITRLNTSMLPDLEFEYDASGKRTKKIVKPKSSPGVLVPANSFVTTYYTYGADGNVMGIYAMENADFKLKEHNIYGSSRLGSLRSNTSFTALPFVLHKGFMDGAIFQLKDRVSERSYELSNHLGNVLATLSDRKLPVDLSNNGSVDYFVSDVSSATDYYAFGMMQPGRQYNSGNARYGFNGKENDNEVKGVGNHQDYGMRVYDPRIGKFFSVDPISSDFPWLSTYQFSTNSPVMNIDLDGLEGVRPGIRQPRPGIGYSTYNTINQQRYNLRRTYQPITMPNGNGATQYRIYEETKVPGGSVGNDPLINEGNTRGHLANILTEGIANANEMKEKLSLDFKLVITTYNAQDSKMAIESFSLAFISPETAKLFETQQSKYMQKFNKRLKEVAGEAPDLNSYNFEDPKDLIKYTTDSNVYNMRYKQVETELGPSPSEKLIKEIKSNKNDVKVTQEKEIQPEFKQGGQPSD